MARPGKEPWREFCYLACEGQSLTKAIRMGAPFPQGTYVVVSYGSAAHMLRQRESRRPDKAAAVMPSAGILTTLTRGFHS